MKMKALIIDDEPLAHDIILEYSNGISFIKIVGQCYLATDALALLKEQEVDLIFLDINMPKLKGLDFLRVLDVKPLVIVTSAYEEYAIESYDLDVCDYLLKPFRFDRFLKACNRAYENYELRQSSQHVVPKETEISKSNRLFIKADKKLIQIGLEEIYFLESYGNYVKIWLENSFHLTGRTLTSFEQQLPSAEFSRIHKSYIINRKHIDFVEGNFVATKNDRQLPIGKNFRQSFKHFLQVE